MKTPDIAVLDFETDPFDAISRDYIAPFCACLYTGLTREPIIIWDEDEDLFKDKVIETIKNLPGKYIIYAHNGGRFDYMFLVNKLRGMVHFKNGSMMSLTIGEHELRDSYHIIPERLAAFQKDTFDYNMLTKAKRNANRAAIIKYVINDCRYTYSVIKEFVAEYGFGLSIGSIAYKKLLSTIPEGHYVPLTRRIDELMREFYFGGRVETIQGAGHWRGDYKLFDVNSMYPAVMVNYRHPVHNCFYNLPKKPSKDHTAFVTLTCDSNGAFPWRDEQTGIITYPKARHTYKVTGHEYFAALDLGLIKNVTIECSSDCGYMESFGDFVLPIYRMRQSWKEKLTEMKAMNVNAGKNWEEANTRSIFLKLLLNNAYGKAGQNPRNFREYYFTDLFERPEYQSDTWGDLPEYSGKEHSVWSRPTKTQTYNNVALAASVTGAARAVLMRAKHSAIDPLYCDTDSLICRDLPGVNISATELGAWDLEEEISEIVICGRKLYAYKTSYGKIKVASKGAWGLNFNDMLDILGGNYKKITAKAPTLKKDGSQHYVDRTIRKVIHGE